jgi:hypothetical protein
MLAPFEDARLAPAQVPWKTDVLQQIKNLSELERCERVMKHFLQSFH